MEQKPDFLFCFICLIGRFSFLTSNLEVRTESGQILESS